MKKQAFHFGLIEKVKASLWYIYIYTVFYTEPFLQG